MVSVIIVNWNGAGFIRECLDSVFRQTYEPYEVIVVDNGSTDNSVDLIERYYPAVRIVRLEDNRGFTGGNIAGLNVAKGEFILLLNTDAVLAEDWMEAVQYALNKDDRIGICFTKLIITGTSLIDSAGDHITNAFNAVKIGEHKDSNVFTASRFTTGACAAAVMYRKAMLDEIGFFDEDFFLYAEDTDLNMRAWLAGWKCLFIPESVAYHKVSATSGALSNIAVYHYSRNIEWVWIKNVPFKAMIKYLPQRILYEGIAFFYYCVVSGKCVSYCRGKIDACLKLPTMIKKRKKVQELVRLGNKEIGNQLLPFCMYLRSGVQYLRNSKKLGTRNAENDFRGNG